MRDSTFPAGVKPSITVTIRQADGTTYELTDKNLQAGSVSFSFGTSNSGEFTIGGAVIGSFKFSIINRNQLYDTIDYVNATVEPVLSFDGKTLNMGKYWFVNHKETGSVIVCETYDALQILDEHQIHEDDITYPTTIQALANKIASKRGFTVTGILNGSTSISDPKNDDMTERECFSYLAQMTGQYVLAKGNELVFSTYSKTKFYDAGVTFSHDLRTEPIAISGVKVYPDGSETSTDGGSTGYMIEIRDNPFITSENVSRVVSALTSYIVGLAFHPGTFSIRANPAIEAGDGLKITTDKRTVKAYATTITYKLQLQESITADADEYAGDMRLSKRQKISQIAKKAAQNVISDDLKNPDSDLSQAIGGGSGKWNSRYAPLCMFTINEAIIAYINELDYKPSSDWNKGFDGTHVGVVLVGGAYVSNDTESRYYRYDYPVNIVFKPFSIFVPNPDFTKQEGTNESVNKIKGVLCACDINLYSLDYGHVYRVENGQCLCDITITQTGYHTDIDIHILELYGSSLDRSTANLDVGVYTIVRTNYGSKAGCHIKNDSEGCSIKSTWTSTTQ